MVDRITPATTDRDRDDLRERYGVEDGWPVVCEPFRQWVLQDDFGPGGRPPLADVGVQLVADVEPYEAMKLRLLNATHQALCYVGWLLGHRWVHEAASDPAIVTLLRRYMAEEALPTLAPVPGIDLAAYRETLLERYANSQVGDTVARLCTDTSDRIPRWVLPTIRDNLAPGRRVALGALVVASWARSATGVAEQRRPHQVVDRRSDALVAAARAQASDPTAFLRQPDLFGDLVEHAAFREPYLRALGSFLTHGTRATLADLAAPTG